MTQSTNCFPFHVCCVCVKFLLCTSDIPNQNGPRAAASWLLYLKFPAEYSENGTGIRFAAPAQILAKPPFYEHCLFSNSSHFIALNSQLILIHRVLGVRWRRAINGPQRKKIWNISAQNMVRFIRNSRLNGSYYILDFKNAKVAHNFWLKPRKALWR